jgi:hypothetical protein
MRYRRRRRSLSTRRSVQMTSSRKLHIDSNTKPVGADAQLSATIRSQENSKAHGNSSWRRARIRTGVRSCETVYDLISSSRFSVCLLDYVSVFKVIIVYPEFAQVPRDSTTVEGVVARSAGANIRPPIGAPRYSANSACVCACAQTHAVVLCTPFGRPGTVEEQRQQIEQHNFPVPLEADRSCQVLSFIHTGEDAKVYVLQVSCRSRTRIVISSSV